MNKIGDFIASYIKAGIFLLLILTCVAFIRSCNEQGLDPSPTDHVPKVTATP